MFHRALERAKCCNAAIAAVVSLCSMAPRLAQAAGDAADGEEKLTEIPRPSGVLQLSVSAGLGFWDRDDFSNWDRYGVAYGARAGYTFAGTPLYLGVTLQSYDSPARDDSESIVALDFEVGYAFAADPFIVRPYLGLGAHIASDSGYSAIVPRLIPGLLVWYPMGLFAVGAEARCEQAGTGTARGLTLVSNFGVGF